MRVKSGMRNAKAKGKHIGRPRTTSDTIPDRFWKFNRMYQNREINVSDFARIMKCSRPTLYKYLSIANDAAK